MSIEIGIGTSDGGVRKIKRDLDSPGIGFNQRQIKGSFTRQFKPAINPVVCEVNTTIQEGNVSVKIKGSDGTVLNSSRVTHLSPGDSMPTMFPNYDALKNLKPEIQLQENPIVNNTFTSDLQTWKVRHKHGGILVNPNLKRRFIRYISRMGRKSLQLIQSLMRHWRPFLAIATALTLVYNAEIMPCLEVFLGIFVLLIQEGKRFHYKPEWDLEESGLSAEQMIIEKMNFCNDEDIYEITVKSDNGYYGEKCNNVKNMLNDMKKKFPNLKGNFLIHGEDQIWEKVDPEKITAFLDKQNYPSADWEIIGVKDAPKFFGLRHAHQYFSGKQYNPDNCYIQNRKTKEVFSVNEIRAQSPSEVYPLVMQNDHSVIIPGTCTNSINVLYQERMIVDKAINNK